jgi:hypothetical protein
MTQSRRFRFQLWTSRILSIAACTAAAALAGCYWEGGSGVSLDQHPYISTSWNPYTITLRDTRTGQAFWSVDVPVGKQLVIHFRDDLGKPGTATPDSMEWDIMEPGTLSGPLMNSLAVPPFTARRIDVDRRATPELPEDMGGGAVVRTTTDANSAKPAPGTKP